MYKLSRVAVAVVLLAGMAETAMAFHCGAARYACCRRTCCEPVAQQCCTVMKTCQQVIYQQRQYTCYRTCYEPVCEQHTVAAVRYETETRCRECVETVWRPVYQTCQREVFYNVCKPVTYTQTVQVCGGHWETRTTQCCKPNPCNPCARR